MALSGTDQRLRRTRRRLFVVTMGLLTLLVVGIGTATAVMGMAAIDADTDDTLRAAVQPYVRAISNGLVNSEGNTIEESPVAWNTLVLVLDASGRIVMNPSGRQVAGMPFVAALSATASGDDMRTMRTGGHNIRLLTVRVAHNAEVIGFVQGGFILDLHDRESQGLAFVVAIVSGLGLLSATLVTRLVIGRALGPIREGFESQRRFVVDASHELRTPVALIRANAEVLEREGLAGHDGDPLLQDIISESDRLGALVGDMLQLATWDENRMTLNRVSLDVAPLAKTTTLGAEAFAAARGVRLTFKAEGSAPVVADKDRLVQLILVLLGNAIDRSSTNGVVNVHVHRKLRSVFIEVDDQGPEIAVEGQRRILEPFARLPGTTRHGSSGTGLGLAVARRIAEAHKGSIRVEPTVGGGARFVITVPAAAAADPT
jgi:signal transduction histidine kinase